jgi:hypothetical protein
MTYNGACPPSEFIVPIYMPVLKISSGRMKSCVFHSPLAANPARTGAADLLRPRLFERAGTACETVNGTIPKGIMSPG